MGNVKRYRRRQDVHFAGLPDGGFALLDAQRSVFHGGNTVGRRIWELLAEPCTQQDVVTLLLREYVVDKERCEAEVAAFFSQLQTQDLIEPCGF